MNIFENLNRLKEYNKMQADRENLISLIDEARERLSTLSGGFDMVENSALIDYYIYEKRAASVHYTNLLNKFKNSDYNMEKPRIFPFRIFKKAQ